MNIQPIGERVLLERIKKEERTKGGIIIPESAQEEKKEGIVIAAGTFKDGKKLPLRKGDRVIYGGYSSEELEVDDKKYLLIDFKDVMAKLEGMRLEEESMLQKEKTEEVRTEEEQTKEAKTEESATGEAISEGETKQEGGQ